MTQPVIFIIPGACSFGSQALLEWLNIPYQVGLVPTTEIRQSKAFLKINPLGKVAALKDGEFLVSESLAILYYLANKHNKFAISEFDLEQKTKIFQWLEYGSTSLHASFSPCFHPERFVSAEIADKYKPDAIKRLITNLDYIEDHLSKNDYFVANTLSIADLQLFGLLRWIERVFTENKYSNIIKFRQRIMQLDFVQNALLIEKNNSKQIINSQFAGYYKLED